jgi:hypothetical protein
MLMVVMNGSQLIRMPLSKTGLAHFDGKTRQDRICLIWLTVLAGGGGDIAYERRQTSKETLQRALKISPLFHYL